MSSGLHPEWYTDPPWDTVSLSWLQNYANNIRSNPELLQSLQAETSQFEMVPVPRGIIEGLAKRGPSKT